MLGAWTNADKQYNFIIFANKYITQWTHFHIKNFSFSQISLMNFNYFFFQLNRNKWRHFDAPRHSIYRRFCLYAHKTLCIIMHKTKTFKWAHTNNLIEYLHFYVRLRIVRRMIHLVFFFRLNFTTFYIIGCTRRILKNIKKSQCLFVSVYTMVA